MDRIKRLLRVLRRSGWTGLRYAAARRLMPSALWDAYSREALTYAAWMDFSAAELAASRAVHSAHPGQLAIQSLTWYIPEFSSPYYGGIHTILRFAEYLTRAQGVHNRFAVIGSISPSQVAGLMRQTLPGLGEPEVYSLSDFRRVADLPASDAGICTLWGTAFFLLRENRLKRKFYFLQDDETRFYPAGSLSGLVEASYRFGFIGLANTPGPAEMYRTEYQGQSAVFYPAVDQSVFHPVAVAPPEPPYRVFWYARPGHPRNGFELCAQALGQVKARLGSAVEIVAAGDDWNPAAYGLAGVVRNLGRLTYAQTADLYRTCHLGLVMMFTRHPSYIPLELMASGCPVVSNINPHTAWFFSHLQNCCLAENSAASLAAAVCDTLADPALRRQLAQRGLQNMQQRHASWDEQFANLYTAMNAPVADL